MTQADAAEGFGEDHATQIGWTVGGGLDYAVSSRLTVRGEYLYDDYSRKSYTITAPPDSRFFPSYTAEVSLTAQTIRAAVLYRF